MKVQKFFTQYDPAPPQPELNDGKSKTEQTYVSMEEQIRSLMTAGVNLLARRRVIYGKGAREEGDPIVDPLSRKGVDLVDAVNSFQATVERVEAQVEASKVKAQGGPPPAPPAAPAADSAK